MSSSIAFRRRLAVCILGAIGASSLVAACQGEVASGAGQGGNGGGNGNGGNGGAGSDDTSVTTTSGQPTGGMNPCWPAAGGDESIQCLAWPQPMPATGSAGGDGGASGVGGEGGAGGLPPCPDPLDANQLFGTGPCGYTVNGPGAYADGECCYPVTQECCSGRPFLVDDRARTAGARRGAAGWTAPLRPSVEGLDARTRASLAEAWLRDALLEHASVASFSRFALELLAVGAPSELVDAAHAAARDEVAHARACFALASAYAGAELAPARFDFGGRVEIASDLGAVAASAVKEGCVGETLAAIQAAEQLAAATDPAVREALAAIARDEARHAELAWRFVAWAIEAGGEPVRFAVAAAFASVLAAPPAASPAEELSVHAPAHGRVGPAVLRAAFDATIAEAILPAARSLTRAAA